MPAVRARTDDARSALALAACAFGVRLSWGLAAGVTPGATFDDAFWYHRTATLLATGHGYLNPVTAQPTAAWPPGYALVLALAYRVAGASPTTAVVLNAAFGALTCLFVWRLGARLADGRVGLVAAALLAAYPGHVFFSALMLSETLFTCLVCGLLLAASALLDGGRRTRPLWWLAWGVGVGATALVRAESVVLALVPVVPLALAGDRRAARRTLAATLAGMGLALAPWTARNATVFGAFVPTSTGFGRTLWIGHNDAATGGMTPEIQAAMHRAIIAAGISPATPAGELAMDRMLRARAIDFALAHPLRELGLTPRRTYHLFRGDHVWQAWYGAGTPRVAPSDTARRLLGVGGNVAYLALGLLAIAGWFLRRAETRTAWRPLATFVGVWIAMFTAIYGDPRFHHVLIPVACVLAAVTLTRLADRRRETRKADRGDGRRDARPASPGSPSFWQSTA